MDFTNANTTTKQEERFSKIDQALLVFLDLGYRYQSKLGIMMRAGINPGVALGRHDQLGRNEHGVDRAAVIYPYISIGYNF